MKEQLKYENAIKNMSSSTLKEGLVFLQELIAKWELVRKQQQEKSKKK